MTAETTRFKAREVSVVIIDASGTVETTISHIEDPVEEDISYSFSPETPSHQGARMQLKRGDLVGKDDTQKEEAELLGEFVVTEDLCK